MMGCLHSLTRLVIVVLIGLLIGSLLASHLMPDNRLASLLRGDPLHAMHVSFDNPGSNYARCHAPRCTFV